ncbi:MAG: hypothetical protein MK033_01830 [Candidatus Caenarcaniphilales bacterium]|nr:hypothetical protein [Candidatus Caenarcaniphilales bacterium]
MAFTDQEKRRFKAIVKRLRKEKGIRFYKHECEEDLARAKKGMSELEKIKEESKDMPIVVEEAEKAHKKLQTIVSNLNEYMSILHPEGLFDIGDEGDSTPQKTIVASG